MPEPTPAAERGPSLALAERAESSTGHDPVRSCLASPSRVSASFLHRALHPAGRWARCVRAACLVAGSWATFGLPLSVALAQTPVSGAIEADARWAVAGSPYVVSRHVDVRNRTTLTVGPGVERRMAPSASLAVHDAALQALGTAEAPIVVRSERAARGTATAGDYGVVLFAAGSLSSRLEHVSIQHGSGVVVQRAGPTFNYVDSRDQRDAAITVDLATSLKRVGNRASGNDLNGIAVPADDTTRSVSWGFRGLPNVVQAGVVPVRVSPGAAPITPRTVERGQAVTVTVDGERLGTLDIGPDVRIV